MLCPECEDISAYLDCNIGLVPNLIESEYPELAVICAIFDEQPAYIIKGFFEN